MTLTVIVPSSRSLVFVSNIINSLWNIKSQKQHGFWLFLHNICVFIIVGYPLRPSSWARSGRYSEPVQAVILSLPSDRHPERSEGSQSAAIFTQCRWHFVRHPIRNPFGLLMKTGCIFTQCRWHFVKVLHFFLPTATSVWKIHSPKCLCASALHLGYEFLSKKTVILFGG